MAFGAGKGTTGLGASDSQRAVLAGRSHRWMARYCDELAFRVNAETAVSADVSATLGQELALLRAEVHHLRALVAASDRSR